MTSAQETRSTGRLAGRTRVITVASITAVALAGAIAMAANIGILNNASATTVGKLSAANDLTPPTTQVVDVYLPGPAATTAPAPAAADRHTDDEHDGGTESHSYEGSNDDD